MLYIIVIPFIWGFLHCSNITSKDTALTQNSFLNLSEAKQLVGDLLEQPQINHSNFVKLTLFLKQLQHNFSSISKLYSIGKSAQGRDLWVIIISDLPDQHEPGDLCVIVLAFHVSVE